MSFFPFSTAYTFAFSSSFDVPSSKTVFADMLVATVSFGLETCTCVELITQLYGVHVILTDGEINQLGCGGGNRLGSSEPEVLEVGVLLALM